MLLTEALAANVELVLADDTGVLVGAHDAAAGTLALHDLLVGLPELGVTHVGGADGYRRLNNNADVTALQNEKRSADQRMCTVQRTGLARKWCCGEEIVSQMN